MESVWKAEQGFLQRFLITHHTFLPDFCILDASMRAEFLYQVWGRGVAPSQWQ